jgi:Kef-type K+ transport system membrane component KefB
LEKVMSFSLITAEVIGDVGLVLVVSSLFGALARRCGQPAVIGQIIAGILLGPTLLGRLPGDPTKHLFHAAVLPYISLLSQIAIVIFMFVVGYELDLRTIRGRGRAVPLVASSALLLPMALGAGAVLLWPSGFTALGQRHVTSRSFILFMAVAVAITALPVLAAIVRERGLAGTQVGSIATAAAGVMDVAAWLVLAAALIGTGQAPGRSWPVTVALLVGFVAAMLIVVRPLLGWWFRNPRLLLANQLPVALALALGCAYVTASLGLHPVFGGFLAGLVMPRRNGAPDAGVLRPMEQTGNLLLPLFFVVTGLSLNVGGLDLAALAMLALIVVIAGGGKLGSAYTAARLSGLPARPAATIAVLVNTRGLTELIALNVGLQAGLIDQRLFTVLVLMALITTLATGPLLSLVGRGGHTPAPEPRGERSLASTAQTATTQTSTTQTSTTQQESDNGG